MKGQTQRLAEHIAERLQASEIPVDVVNASEPWPGLAVGAHSAVILAASVHAGEHEREMIEFVKNHRGDLDAVLTAFLSVSLSEAGAEDAAASAESRAKSAADVQRMIQRFFDSTGWSTVHVCAVAGALRYSRYNPMIKIVMKRIARQAGASTDTRRDYEFTNWPAIDKFVDGFVAELSVPKQETAAARSTAGPDI